MDFGDPYSTLELSYLAPFERTQLKKEFDCFIASYWNLFQLYICMLCVALFYRSFLLYSPVYGSESWHQPSVACHSSEALALISLEIL
jgi:hypothetical protein